MKDYRQKKTKCGLRTRRKDRKKGELTQKKVTIEKEYKEINLAESKISRRELVHGRQGRGGNSQMEFGKGQENRKREMELAWKYVKLGVRKGSEKYGAGRRVSLGAGK